MSQALEICRMHIGARRRLMIGVVNAAKLVNMKRDALLRESVVSADVIFADGMAPVWASRILGRPLPERVAGIDLFSNLLSLAERDGFSAYFLGAEPGVLGEMLERVQRTYPHLRVAGSADGYFADDESADVAERIRQSRCDMLFVGMSSPKKERFLARWGPGLDVPVCHGVGGSFDVLAGKVRRAPRLWQRLGLEWLYRVVQEPRRMWRRYLETNILFLLMLLGELLRLRLRLGRRAAARTTASSASAIRTGGITTRGITTSR